MKNTASYIFKFGGEGIVLREPKSQYENGRSHKLLKYKVLLHTGFWLVKKPAYHKLVTETCLTFECGDYMKFRPNRGASSKCALM